MGLAIAEPVVIELAELDENVTGGNVTFENPFLIVVKIAVADGEVHAFGANSGAIVVEYRCSGELDVLDDHVISVDHPNAFSLGIGILSFQVRAPVHAAQGEAVGSNDANVAKVKPGVDFNHISILSHRNGGAWGGEWLVRPYLQGRGIGHRRGQ